MVNTGDHACRTEALHAWINCKELNPRPRQNIGAGSGPRRAFKVTCAIQFSKSESKRLPLRCRKRRTRNLASLGREVKHLLRGLSQRYLQYRGHPRPCQLCPLGLECQKRRRALDFRRFHHNFGVIGRLGSNPRLQKWQETPFQPLSASHIGPGLPCRTRTWAPALRAFQPCRARTGGSPARQPGGDTLIIRRPSRITNGSFIFCRWCLSVIRTPSMLTAP